MHADHTLKPRRPVLNPQGGIQEILEVYQDVPVAPTAEFQGPER